MPMTSAEKMTALRKRRAEAGIVERTYWGKEEDHKKMKNIESALLARIKRANMKKIET